MSDKAVDGQESITEFFTKTLSKYQQRSLDRIGDYLNADRPIPEHEIRTIYEMFIDLDERLKRIEDAFK